MHAGDPRHGGHGTIHCHEGSIHEEWTGTVDSLETVFNEVVAD